MTDKEQAEIDEIMEIQEIMQLQQQKMQRQQRTAPKEQAGEEGLGSKIGRGAFATIDYPRSLLAGNVLGAVDLMSKGLAYMKGSKYEPFLREGEYKKAMNPFDLETLPVADEFMKRKGVPEGPTLGQMTQHIPETVSPLTSPVLWGLKNMYSETGEGLPLQRGGALDPSARAMVGAVLDTVYDPLTYATAGVEPVAKKGMLALRGFDPKTMARQTLGQRAKRKAERLGQWWANPVKEGSTSAGRSFYKAAFGRADELAERYGKTGEYAPSEIIYQNRREIRARMAEDEAKAFREIEERQARGEFERLGTSKETAIRDVPQPRPGTGHAKQLQQQSETMSKIAYEKYANIVKEATEAGAKVDYAKHFEPVLKKIDDLLVDAESPSGAFKSIAELKKLRKKITDLMEGGDLSDADMKKYFDMASAGDPGKRSLLEGSVKYGDAVDTEVTKDLLGQSLPAREAILLRLKKGSLYSVDKADELKRDIYGALNNEDWNRLTSVEEGKQLFVDLSNALRNGMEEAVETTIGKGKELTHHGREAGSMLTVRKPMGMEAAKEANRKTFSQMDAIALSYSPLMFGAKAGAKAAGSVKGKSIAGKYLRMLGEMSPKEIGVGVRRGGAQYYSDRDRGNYVEQYPMRNSTSAWQKVGR